MIPSPFTADLAREHQSTLVARATGRLRRPPRRRPRVAALLAVARSLRPRPVPTACPTC